MSEGVKEVEAAKATSAAGAPHLAVALPVPTSSG